MKLIKFVLPVFVSSILLLSTNAFAAGSGNLKLESPDAAAVGMGSAFVGEADRASAVYYNPAGIVQVGRELSAGVTTLSPQSSYKSTSGEKIQARKNTFIFPHVYFTTPLITNKFYFGIGENSNWGSGYNWSSDSSSSFTRYSMIHDEFASQDVMLVGAYKFNDQLSFGVSADNDNSRIEKQKKLYQGASPDGNSQLKARDNAWGYRLSTLFKVNDQHQFGFMYRSAIHHNYTGKLYFNDLNNGGNNFQGIFGGTTFETKATMKFTLPQSLVLGYSFKPTKKWTFNFDVEWLDWSSVKNMTINYPDVSDATQKIVLGTNNPQSKDWKSVWSESIGFQYEATDRLRLRGGYAYHQTPIGNDTWDTAFPDANSHSVTSGLGFDLTKNLTFDLAYVAVFYEVRKIRDNTQDSGFAPGILNLSGTYKQFINLGTATLTYKF